MPKILIIGSNLSQDIIRKALEPSFETTFVLNSNEALEKLRQDRPDAIILGHIEAPDSSLAALQELKESWIVRNIPVILASGELASGNGTDALSLAEPLKPSDLKEKLTEILIKEHNLLRKAILDPDTFCVTWEQIAGRGAFVKQQEDIIKNALLSSGDGVVHGLSVTDNPGGNPAITNGLLSAEIKRIGMEPLVHLACRDRNRNGIESMLHTLAASGIRNVLVLTGDYPASTGFRGMARPVFDLDSIHALQLIEAMNSGLKYELQNKKKTLPATDFFAGVSVSPFKQLEAELMGQYFKLDKKIQAGARFIVTQVGYDARKLHELLQWLDRNGYNIPVIANVYVLPYGAARLMHANQIPGCLVTDKLLAQIENEAQAKDKGRSARMLRAARMYAIARGMGCAGVHIGGLNLNYPLIKNIVKSSEELTGDWEDLIAEFDYPQANGFYLFQKDPKTGLNQKEPVPKAKQSSFSLLYELSSITHALLFQPRSPLYKIIKRVARCLDSSPALKGAFGYLEHMAKVALYRCLDCGDCALFDMAYQCPMSQCPKNQRNGPCGGSFEGWCEVYPGEKKCVWVKTYEKLKSKGKEGEMGAGIAPPCDFELWQTSSWLNYYLGRDHISKRMGIKPPEKKTNR